MALTEQLEFFARTDQGRKRKHNEDNFLVDRDLRLFVVADGMGGHAAGEVASAIAVRTVHEVVAARRDLLQDRTTHGPRSEVSQREILGLLEFAVQEASRRIHGDAQNDARKRGMGTTVSLLLLLESSAYVAHVGDSRIYLVREGQAHQVTEDHTIANELIRLGIVTADAVHNVPNKNAITRAVGVYEHVEVDTLTFEVLPDDQFVLASDGLCGYLDERKVGLVGYLESPKGDGVVDALVGFANDQGGKDNITVVLVRIGSGDVADTARARRVALKREILAQMPLFSRLNEREVLRVMQAAEVYEYEAGEHVVREGEAGDRMFVTLQGLLEVATAGASLGELGPGEHFGEMSLIRSRPRSADVKAIEASALLTIKRDDFFEIIRTEHRLAVKLLWQFLGVLANRLERTSRELSATRGERDTSLERRFWVDEEPSLDPFAGPVSPRSSFAPGRPVTLPGIDDDIEPVPLSFDSAPLMAERREASPPPPRGRPREPTATGLGPPQPGPAQPPKPAPPLPPAKVTPTASQTATPRLEDAPALAAQRDAIISELEDEGGPVTQPRPRRSTLKMRAATEEATPSPGTVPVEGGLDEALFAKKTVALARQRQAEGPVQLSEKKTVPTARVRSETLKSAGGLPRRDAPPRDAPATVKSDDPSFQPTKRTIPLHPNEDFQEELAELRKEFKERLAKARRDRESKKDDS